MEISLRDALLPKLVEGVHVQWCGWDDLNGEVAKVPVQTTMVDFDSTRQTYQSWEDFLEQIVEGAAHCLAWSDLALHTQPWCSTEVLMKTSFDPNYVLFANSWQRLSPMINDKLRLQPLERLSDAKSGNLHDTLEAFGTVYIEVQNSGALGHQMTSGSYQNTFQDIALSVGCICRGYSLEVVMLPFPQTL